MHHHGGRARGRGGEIMQISTVLSVTPCCDTVSCHSHALRCAFDFITATTSEFITPLLPGVAICRDCQWQCLPLCAIAGRGASPWLIDIGRLSPAYYNVYLHMYIQTGECVCSNLGQGCAGRDMHSRRRVKLLTRSLPIFAVIRKPLRQLWASRKIDGDWWPYLPTSVSNEICINANKNEKCWSNSGDTVLLHIVRIKYANIQNAISIWKSAQIVHSMRTNSAR